MREHILNELTRWGQAGYMVSLYHGFLYQQGELPSLGWSCTIRYFPSGTVFYMSDDPDPYGFHPTDPLEAARLALRQAGERWAAQVVEQKQAEQDKLDRHINVDADSLAAAIRALKGDASNG